MENLTLTLNIINIMATVGFTAGIWWDYYEKTLPQPRLMLSTIMIFTSILSGTTFTIVTDSMLIGAWVLVFAVVYWSDDEVESEILDNNE